MSRLAATVGIALAAIIAVSADTLATSTLHAQTFPTDDPVLHRIWSLGMDSSETYPLAQALMDSVGPRLTGTPQQASAEDWIVARYAAWGIDAHKERYGTWKGWDRGVTHVDLLAPRVRTLEATMLAWSPGTDGKNVDGDVIALPAFADSAAFAAWLPAVKGRYVLVSYPQPTCRPDDDWKQWADTGSFVRMDSVRRAGIADWNAHIEATGYTARQLPVRLEQAGAIGVVTNTWSRGWGVDKIFYTHTTRIPTIDVSCEDYGLLFRLAEHGQHPRLRVNATAKMLGELPVYNVIGEIKGTEKPDEYVLLSAHLDSWDGGSGATDNGTGTITMLEAMRILKTAYPHPKRTILAGHWSGEEEGLVGSRAFAADHPEIVKGLEAAFNQDNGTGRIQRITGGGLIDAGAFFGRWFGRLPTELTRDIRLSFPGEPAGGGSDHASFACYGAPAFGLGSLPWSYGLYTWHTNRDTFDKIVFDDLHANATLTAMLAYLASEDPQSIPRERRALARGWPQCQTPPRASAAWTR